jgi:predicted acylesterase/phospholipase RssA
MDEKENLDKDNLNKENLNKDNLDEKETSDNDQDDDQETSNIRHLVLSGGGIWGFKTLGALRAAEELQLLDISKLETIYCTSVGSMIGILLSMKFDLLTIQEYIIKRPWQHVWGINMNNILNIFQTRGIYQNTVIIEYLSPFFKALDYPTDITMQQLYEKTGIEIHIYVTELNHFQSVDICYKTHPDWLVIDAIYTSCCVPILFSPLIKDNKCYIDGSLVMNYPLKKCINDNDNKDQILAILLTYEMNIKPFVGTLSETSSFIDFIMNLIQRFFQSRFFFSDMSCKIPHELRMSSPEFTIDFVNLCINSQDKRREIIQEGYASMQDWIHQNVQKID